MNQCILIGKVVSAKSISDDLTIVNVDVDVEGDLFDIVCKSGLSSLEYYKEDAPIAIKGHMSVCDRKISIIANKISCISFNG